MKHLKSLTQLVNRILPLLLAGLLQVMPLLRAVLPAAKEFLRCPPSWSPVAKLATGAVALFGYHAISSASSITISPANATVGVPYVGTATYSGGHATAVSGFRLNGACLNSTPVNLFSGLTIKYTGGKSAQIQGTPTTSGTFSGLYRVEDFNCGGGHPYERSASLIIGTNGGGGVSPTILVPPVSDVGQLGSEMDLSVGASGTPLPTYVWKQGITVIPGATNATLSFSNLTLANAGLYTVVASNASGTKQATAYLSVCVTPGTNQLEYNNTNFAHVGQATTMTSLITNAPAATNSYKWQFNYGDVTSFSTNGNNLTISAGQATVSKSGNYSIVFRSVVTTNTIVNDQVYDSYWAFGAKPSVTAQPQGTNVVVGTNASFVATAYTSASVYGNGTPVWCSWYRNGVTPVQSQQLVGTNVTSTLNLSNITVGMAGDYTMVASNFWGSVTSSIAALTVSLPVGPTNISFGVSGGNLNLSWPASHVGWILQAQTNPLGVGLQTAPGAWFDLPGSGSLTATNIAIGAGNPAVFFRLRKP